MAINLVDKRRALARDMVQACPALMDVVYRLEALYKRRQKGDNGNALTFTDTDFDGQAGLAHLDAARLESAFAIIPTIVTALASNDFDDKLESVRG